MQASWWRNLCWSAPVLVINDYMQILDYQFVEISFEHANRAGEAKNITVKEYLNAITMHDYSMVNCPFSKA